MCLTCLGMRSGSIPCSSGRRMRSLGPGAPWFKPADDVIASERNGKKGTLRIQFSSTRSSFSRCSAPSRRCRSSLSMRTSLMPASSNPWRASKSRSSPTFRRFSRGSLGISSSASSPSEEASGASVAAARVNGARHGSQDARRQGRRQLAGSLTISCPLPRSTTSRATREPCRVARARNAPGPRAGHAPRSPPRDHRRSAAVTRRTSRTPRPILSRGRRPADTKAFPATKASEVGNLSASA